MSKYSTITSMRNAGLDDVTAVSWLLWSRIVWCHVSSMSIRCRSSGIPPKQGAHLQSQRTTVVGIFLLSKLKPPIRLRIIPGEKRSPSVGACARKLPSSSWQFLSLRSSAKFKGFRPRQAFPWWQKPIPVPDDVLTEKLICLFLYKICIEKRKQGVLKVTL